MIDDEITWWCYDSIYLISNQKLMITKWQMMNSTWYNGILKQWRLLDKDKLIIMEVFLLPRRPRYKCRRLSNYLDVWEVNIVLQGTFELVSYGAREDKLIIIQLQFEEKADINSLVTNSPHNLTNDHPIFFRGRWWRELGDFHLILHYGDEVIWSLAMKPSYVGKRKNSTPARCEFREKKYYINKMWTREDRKSFEGSDMGISLGLPKLFWNRTSKNQRIWMDG